MLRPTDTQINEGIFVYASLTLQSGGVATIKLGLGVVLLVTGYLDFTLVSCCRYKKIKFCYIKRRARKREC